ncbi:MAG: D-Ala-D-Ala carboxypeptidase family metallohydrolase [Candidatus Cloacimonetes bacterium]|nr:D-Ala-D-Ala carboxypeptidase family metallohydrolase [Candidatus Cloacimonadota bacterium]
MYIQNWNYKNFRKEKAQCSCGCGCDLVSKSFMDKVQKARDIANRPFYETSVCRCERENIRVNGSLNSDHITSIEKKIYCCAMDISYTDSIELYEIIKACMEARLPQIIVYASKKILHVGESILRPRKIFLVEK